MPQAQTFAADPRVLTWARERTGLSTAAAAEALHIPIAELEAIEGGADSRVSLLERMSTVYSISFTTLLAPAPPPSRRRPPDYRTVEGRIVSLSPEVAIAISTAQVEQEMITRLANELDEPLAILELPRAELGVTDPELLGLAERERLGVSDDDQVGWSNALEALRTWRTRVEEAGTFVFARPMPREDCRGFSLYDADLAPVVVINSREVYQARLFTLLHEYAHVLLRTSGICNEREDAGRQLHEVFANRFAASALLPRSVLSLAAAVLNYDVALADSWTEEEVSRVARRLKVSRPALAIRLEQLGLATPGFTETLDLSWDDDSWTPQGGGPVPQHTQILGRLGERYVELVIQAVDRGNLDTTGADEFLNARAIHLPALRGQLAAREVPHVG